MKKILFLLAGALVFTNLFVSTGCEDDPVVDPVKDPPLVFVTDQPTTNLAPGATFTIVVDASKGTDDLASMEITEDGARIDASRIVISGISLSNNPQSVPAADKASFVWDVTITAHSAVETHTYEVIITDAGGLTDKESFNVTIEDPGTPISMELTGVLLNQAGPMGTGGLDLDTGTGTGSAAATAEIRDWGIDLGQPNATNWIQKIGGVNGTVVKYLAPNTIENFDFSAVLTVEEIEGARDAATEIVSNMSQKVLVGDIFVAVGTSRTYLIHVDEVNVTSNDNSDNYKLSIKY